MNKEEQPLESVKVFPNTVLVKKQEEEIRTASGLYIPSSKKNPPLIGKIISVAGNLSNDSLLKDGLTIRFDKYSGSKINDDLFVLYKDQVLLIEHDLSKETWEERITIPSNYVLVKCDWELGSVNKIPGSELYVDGSINKEMHAPTSAEVVAVCKKIVYNGRAIKKVVDDKQLRQRLHNSSLNWETTLEVNPGDKVHFHYLQIFKSSEEGKYVEIYNPVTYSKERFYLIRYDSLFAVEDDNSVKPINGHVFVEILNEDEIRTSGLIIKSKRRWGFGRVKYISEKMNTDYMSGDEMSDLGTESVTVGDTICFSRFKKSGVGYELYTKESKLHGLYRLQRKDILMVL